MKASYLGTPRALRYFPGDPLLETDRLAALSVRPSGIDAAPPGKPDDLPALRDVLTFLKFTPEEIKNLMEAVQSTVKIVGGIVSVVGVATSVVELMNKLGVFGPKEDATQVALAQIGTRLNQIYNYLVESEIKGLHLQAVDWRSAQSGARNALKNAQLSPTPNILDALVERTAELDTALNKMLSPENASIAFLRRVYGYVPEQNHWIDAALPPFMSRTDGDPINLADTSRELQARIWDAGHYIDVLFSSLSERMLVTVTIEPAFRSTGFDREQLKLLVKELTVFIDSWRSAMLVASPAAGLNGGYPMPFSISALPAPGAGLLQSPYRPQAHQLGSESAPPGIVLGAVDPVTGAAAWEPFYDGFETVGTVGLMDFGLFKEAWGGGYDYIKAKDPAKALAAATQRQAQYLDQVVVASGLGELVKLRAQLQSAALGVSGSEFVRLANAQFRLLKNGIRIDGSPLYAIRKAGVESVDLGGLTPFAQDPGKKHKGTRYFQECEKTFRIRMALRTRRTRIQLGYRLRIGSTDIPLVPFSNGGFLGSDLTPFPTETIVIELHEAVQVYNVRQSHVFSFAEEDLFEAGEPFPVGASKWAIPGWRGRLFLDERAGAIALAVEVRFEHDPTGQKYAAEAIVTIRNLDPEGFPDGAIVPVWVYETHMDDSTPPQPQEVVADSMTVHLVPSFLVMEPEFFAAYWGTVEFLAKTTKHLNDRFKRQERMQQRPNPDPAWAVRRRVLDTMAMAEAIDALGISQPEAVAEVMQRFRPPAMRD
ncbi:MAG: hypothetical protein ABI782_07120 [Anaerolineaceae bacterium]